MNKPITCIRAWLIFKNAVAGMGILSNVLATSSRDASNQENISVISSDVMINGGERAILFSISRTIRPFFLAIASNFGMIFLGSLVILANTILPLRHVIATGSNISGVSVSNVGLATRVECSLPTN